MVPTAVRTEARSPLRSRSTPALLTFAALAQIVTGGFFLVQSALLRDPPPLLAAAGLVLLLAALLQARIIWKWVRGNRLRPLPRPHHLRLLALWMLAGVVLGYALNLLVGAGAAQAPGFTAALGLWYTLGLLPLVIPPERLAKLLELLRRRSARYALWSGYALLIAPLAAELGLRVYAAVLHDPISVQYQTARLKLPPGAELGGLRVNQLGYWDDEFESEVPPGTFRVAVVGDDLTLSGDARSNFLQQIERHLPGVEVYNFGLPRGGVESFAAQMIREIAPYQPDLVLAVVSVGADLTEAPPQPAFLDRDWLFTYQLGTLLLQGREPQGGGLIPASAEGQQAYLDRGARQLAVCRTPIDAPMQSRWENMFADLDELRQACENHGVSMGLVVSPSEFQVNPTLCKVLQRRAGCREADLDLELPQRRIAQYVQQRRLLMLDLLPYLRRSAEPTYERNQPGFNDHGHTLAADVIGHWMQSHFHSLIASNYYRPATQ